jgi:hypothetical protein
MDALSVESRGELLERNGDKTGVQSIRSGRIGVLDFEFALFDGV